MALQKTDTLYDAIIVGSGAGGGMAAYQLSIQGMKVLVLEAGRDYDPVAETPMFKTPKDAPLRGAGNADKPFGFYDATVDGGWRVPGEPYTTAPGSEFQWWRSRMLGGRTNHWGRISLRMGEYDFKPKSRDGLGDSGYGEVECESRAHTHARKHGQTCRRRPLDHHGGSEFRLQSYAGQIPDTLWQSSNRFQADRTHERADSVIRA